MFEQITARELANELDADDDEYAIVDTRPADSYESWHVPEAENVPFGPAETLGDEQEAEIDDLVDGNPIVTICGKGATSTTLAGELDANGYDDVAVVKGGMRDWNSLYERARVDTDDDVGLTQFQRRGKGCLSYLVWSPDAGEAAVVDPTRHIDQYVVAAAEHDAEITHVLDTHVHADHVSGGRELAERLDVPYHLGARAEERDLEYEYEPLEDGDSIHVGDVEITALAAPGHTTEMVNYRVDDEAILTGDALFVDSVGRTELEFGEDQADEGAEMEYETLHETLTELPDDLTVLPGHVTVTNDGRFENGSPGRPVAASLEEVERRLDLLELGRDEFVERMVENVPEKPDNYETVIDVNTGRERPDSSRQATKLETGANNCSA
ncbi:MBL fold metallo-hydrolase [Natrinema halophilum]|uniref:MBL fold metallo-hydrolase n=1 Tax=Natrinema halophilum TaxID=1699371 RepID=A0A7D5GSJ0_9EURY|nr:rhodanese-like domain-containing protein [Natrinema halophilum]QLG49349.1 MBL fold metallo-hydrolase [Natrinema halophilum]